MTVINKLGDKLLATLLPKAKASACNVCSHAYTGCGGSQCFYYYNRVIAGQVRCTANTGNYCEAPYVSYRLGCC